MVLEAGGSSPLGHPIPIGPMAVARLRRASSSTRQSNGLLIRRFGVRIPGGPPSDERCSSAARHPVGRRILHSTNARTRSSEPRSVAVSSPATGGSGGSQPPSRIGHTGCGGAVCASVTALVRSCARPSAQRVIRFRIDVVIDAEMRRGPPQQRRRHEVQLDHRDIVRPVFGTRQGSSARQDVHGAGDHEDRRHQGDHRLHQHRHLRPHAHRQRVCGAERGRVRE